LNQQDEWRAKYRIHLHTPRLLLRPLIESDTAWLTELLCDAEVCQFLWDGPSEREQAHGAAQAIVNLDLWHCRFGHWAILDRKTAAIHGWVELSKLRPWDGPSDEIAISYVLRRHSWGQGIATEAAGRLLQFAFEFHRLDRVMAVIMSGNLASRRVLEKLEMRFVKKTLLRNGKELAYFIRTVASPPDPPE
jgi:[ribosomal protein S5]-alanine N-acetyltransferase